MYREVSEIPRSSLGALEPSARGLQKRVRIFLGRRESPPDGASLGNHPLQQTPVTLILGIESSCDETAVAIVRNGTEILAHTVASQIDLHKRFGGVIPEVASRSHLEAIFPLLEDTLVAAGVSLSQIEALAVTQTPGLIGCLLVGLSTAKGLALATGLPIVPVNHVHAHIYGALMAPTDSTLPLGPAAWIDPERPLAALVVSGGHTSLYASYASEDHRLMGRSIDDAAGEAYDKVAAILGQSYPGGPVIDRLAKQGNPKAFAFPRSKVPGLNFSFSGLKTAVLYGARGPNSNRRAPLLPDLCIEDVAASFQAAVVDVLAEKLVRCATSINAQGLVVCGGVAANSALRERCAAEAASLKLPLYLPTPALATDNAVMVAGLAQQLFSAGKTADLSVDASPRAD
ncbi:MAG: N6-L-threonylcarbamoyladenine synthase [Pseudohongiellaceae bacterium]|jgi:N6-L-threonylcarbamoyladenine synthase